MSTLFERMSAIARGHRPSVFTAWNDLRARGLAAGDVDRLISGQEIHANWLPPMTIGQAVEPGNVDARDSRFQFRLHFAPKVSEWYIDGTGGELKGWLPVEGPFDLPEDESAAGVRLAEILLERKA